MSMATLYIVGTPIGNLEDITLRAINTLRSVDMIFCEDTQTTRKLLQKYEISTATDSYHAQSGAGKIERIISLLQEGKNIAYVSDAGTPGISDPGSLMVSIVKEQCGNEVGIVPIPGASALTAALSACGLPTHEFVFLGFLPHKKGRQTLFEEIKNSSRTTVFYESPHRIMKTLESLKILEDRKIVIARELTKIHEEFATGSAEELFLHYTTNADRVRGEFVVIVGAK
jgi:16S rRNA (cytidine1402-2'-O)-methyltransferase